MTSLKTERLRLRPPTLADAPAIQRLASQPEIARTTLNIPHPYPDGGAEQFLRDVAIPGWERETPDYTFAVIRCADDELMGVIGLHCGTYQRAELGYWIGVPYWNQGYATEAARRVIQFGFEKTDLNRIWAGHFTFNPASRRVQEKVGMTFEGVLRQNYIKDGQFVDSGICSILREEWVAAT